jgi:excisionase family DNA binding protein
LESKNPSAFAEQALKSAREKTSAKKDFPTILTAPEVAEILNINIQRVYELVRSRKRNGMPVIKLGERQYRFSREAILEWMNRENQ